MPITEIVRVLATGSAVVDGARVRVELFYDVDGRRGPDEQATSRPWFWLDLGAGPALGPFDDEPQALEAADDLGVTWGGPAPP